MATDASPAMLALAHHTVPDAHVAQLTLPDDPIPTCDAVVAVGHPFSYLPDEDAIDRAFVAAARSLRPGGVLAVDICDLEWGVARQGAENLGRVGEDWAIVTEFSMPSPARFVRQMAVFVRTEDGAWRRDDERHENVLIDTTRLPGLLSQHKIDAAVGTSFGGESLPVGLRTVVGRKLGTDASRVPQLAGT